MCCSFVVTLGWVTNKPLSLLLDPFQSLVSDSISDYVCNDPSLPERSFISQVINQFQKAKRLTKQTASVQIMSHVVADGRSNWLEGLILICRNSLIP